MTSFFSLNGSLPQPNPSSVTAHRDSDPFSSMNRQGHNPASYTPQSLSRTTSNTRVRNGHGHGQIADSAVPVRSGLPTRMIGAEPNGNSMGPMPMFDMARSPPNTASNKNTKHVPCKFFMQGACQAGSACPFSHTVDPLTQQAPCKYFMKGNCKFGAKCALAHFLPDGRRVNRSDLDYGAGMNGRPFNFGGRVEPPVYPKQDSALATSLLSQQQYQPSDLFPPQYNHPEHDDTDMYNDRYNTYSQPFHMTTTEAGVHSPPGSHFGSPPDDYLLPRSPVENIRTALNAPLPQSFDADGISHIAKYGPLGHSLPDKFGFRSPPGSLPQRTMNPAEAANGLTRGSRGASPLASSPQTHDESLSARVVQAQRLSRTRGLPSSVPKSGLVDDWDDRLNFDADLLPNSLHDEVLTPQEKIRRSSRPEQDGGQRESSSALAIPSNASSKVGSPGAAGSPSRFRALWEEQREKKGNDINSGNNNNNVLGHVGSPLRESWMPNNESNTQRNTSMSAISQQMAWMRLDRTEPGESNGIRPQPSGLRNASAPPRPFEGRTISSPRLLGKKIDEDGEGAFFFPMDEDSKRNSLAWPGRSPGLEPIRDPLDSNTLRENRPIGYGSNGTKPMFPFQR